MSDPWRPIEITEQPYTPWEKASNWAGNLYDQVARWVAKGYDNWGSWDALASRNEDLARDLQRELGLLPGIGNVGLLMNGAGIGDALLGKYAVAPTKYRYEYPGGLPGVQFEAEQPTLEAILKRLDSRHEGKKGQIQGFASMAPNSGTAFSFTLPGREDTASHEDSHSIFKALTNDYWYDEQQRNDARQRYRDYVKDETGADPGRITSDVVRDKLGGYLPKNMPDAREVLRALGYRSGEIFPIDDADELLARIAGEQWEPEFMPQKNPWLDAYLKMLREYRYE